MLSGNNTNPMFDSGSSCSVLVVSADLHVQGTFSDVLSDSGLPLTVARTAAEAQEILTHLPVCVVFCSDELLNGGFDQLLLPTLRASKRIPLIVISRLNDWERCREFMQRGALDYVLYPFGKVEVERIVSNAMNLAQLRNTWESAPDKSNRASTWQPAVG